MSHLTPVFHSIECSTSGEYMRPLNTATEIVLNEKPFVALYSFFWRGCLNVSRIVLPLTFLLLGPMSVSPLISSKSVLSMVSPG